jgi:signal transduction histidine kinase
MGTPAVVPHAASASIDSDLLSSICHDLKAPLASIAMGAGLLRRLLPVEDAAALRVLEAMCRASDRMSEVIVSFSDLAKIARRDLVLQPRLYDIGAIVRTALEILKQDASLQGVPFSHEVASEVETLRVRCDRERILQVFRLLGTSVLRVVPAGGSVRMRAEVEGSGALRVELEAKRPSPLDSRRITAELPRPELAIARGLIALHGSDLSVVGDGNALALSFALPASS